MEWTTIAVTSQTKDELKKLGKMGDSYDDIVQFLLKEVKKHGH